jgi:hypothetical protein
VTVLVKLDGKANAFKECYTICGKKTIYQDKHCRQIMKFKVRERDIGHATILG